LSRNTGGTTGSRSSSAPDREIERMELREVVRRAAAEDRPEQQAADERDEQECRIDAQRAAREIAARVRVAGPSSARSGSRSA
jgi:hypothetical protein